jgi:hypothetical protein
MGLLPEEEEAFADLVSRFGGWTDRRIPWAVVALSVVAVGAAVDGAVLVGVHHHFAILFWVSFVVALAVGLALFGLADRGASRSNRRFSHPGSWRRGRPPTTRR